MCPVVALDAYMAIARAGGWLFKENSLFFPHFPKATVKTSLDANGGPLIQPSEPMTNANINEVMRVRLTEARIFEGETSHGLRAGGGVHEALSLQLQGVKEYSPMISEAQISAVMYTAYWKSPATAKHHLRLLRVLLPGTVSFGNPVTTAEYHRLNQLPTKEYSALMRANH